jgi:hypothetical protein
MNTDYLIRHKDLAKIGYYFIDAQQERLFLDAVNDEFAERVGEHCLEITGNDMYENPIRLADKIKKALDTTGTDINSIILEIRQSLLNDLKQDRKLLLYPKKDTSPPRPLS